MPIAAVPYGHWGTMITTVFDSGSLPVDERLPQFNDFQQRCEDPMAVTAEPYGFQARVRALDMCCSMVNPNGPIRDLGTVNLVELACSEAGIRRTAKQIRQSDPGYYSVVLPVRGRIQLAQAERHVELGPADLALYTSSDPLQVRLDRGTTLLRAHLPRTSLPLPSRKLDGLVATPLPSRSGLGSVLSAFFAQLTSDDTPYSPADMTRLSAVAVDLVTAVLAHHLDADTPEHARQTVLLPQIQTFIRRNLDDPELSPGSIAAAHHISVSYLHRLFQEHEMTVAAWIRRQRLDRAGRDLADPDLRDLSIHRIASRWGFADHATFTRAFRAAYGVPPREYRQRELARGERENALLAS